MSRKKSRYVSLFSGAGGLDLGLEMAGWESAYTADSDVDAVSTLKANVGFDLGRRRALGGACIEQADVRRLRGADILQKSGLTRGSVPLLVGGPPCQSWSSAGHQLGFADPRGRLFDEFVRLAGEIDSRWLLLENVRGLLTARGPDNAPGSALLHIRRLLLRSGFQTSVALLNAADFGVPQRRVRLFMIAFREGDAPPFPSPTHSKGGMNGDLPWNTLANALSAMPALADEEIIRPSGKLAVELADMMPGNGVKSPGKAERTRPNGHWGYKQGAFVANLLQPGRTITANQQQDWVRDEERGLRRLCPRECAIIQGFPSDWRFIGNVPAQYRLIGNAVPPPVAAAIGQSLLNHRPSRRTVAPLIDGLLPLPSQLAYHIRYTAREDASNGPSRRAAPGRRQGIGLARVAANP